MTSNLKSIGAILAGFILIFILAVGLDHLLEHAGLMQTETFGYNAFWVIAVVILGRFLFNIAGSYLTARLAAQRPMLHAMILGVAGLLINAGGAVIMWKKTPHWFPVLLILLPLPCAWIAGKLAEQNKILKNK